MKYIWMIIFVLMLAGIGMAYLITSVMDYLLPDRSEAEIVVVSPDISK